MAIENRPSEFLFQPVVDICLASASQMALLCAFAEGTIIAVPQDVAHWFRSHSSTISLIDRIKSNRSSALFHASF